MPTMKEPFGPPMEKGPEKEQAPQGLTLDKKQPTPETKVTLEMAITRLKVLLEKLNPETFGPSWIENKNLRIYKHFKSLLRREDQTLDWSLVLNQLDETWKKRWVKRESRRWERNTPDQNLEKDLTDLKTTLEKLKPETFGPRWISDNNPTLFSRLLKSLRDDKDKIDWSKAIQKLTPDWQKRWKQIYETNVTLESAVKGLQTTLEKLNPEKFGPGWIYDNNTRIYGQFKSLIRDKDGIYDWPSIIKQLDEKWQKRWKQIYETNVTLESAVKGLQTTLEKLNPETFGPGWIRKNDVRIYDQLESRIRNKHGAFDWDLMLNKLDEKWQNRWRMIEIQLDSSLKKSVGKLAALLEKKQPAKFNPVWLKKEAPYLYKILLENIIRGPGEPKWELVIASLDRKWQLRWSRITQAAERTPKQKYEDISEVEAVLTSHKNKLYTFVVAKNEEDRKIRETICQELVRLVQRGNEDALKQLTELLKPVLHELFELNPTSYEAIREDSESVEQIIERCALLFKGRDSFLTYLRASLRWYQKDFRKNVSMDEPFGPGGQTLRDIIAKEEEDDEPWIYI